MDDIYDEKTSDDVERSATLVEKILVNPDCQADWRDDVVIKLVNEKLDTIGMKMNEIVVNISNRGSFVSCLVRIQQIQRKKLFLGPWRAFWEFVFFHHSLHIQSEYLNDPIQYNQP